MEQIYTKDQVVQIIEELLKRQDLLTYIMNEENDLFTPEKLFDLAADALGLSY